MIAAIWSFVSSKIGAPLIVGAIAAMIIGGMYIRIQMLDADVAEAQKAVAEKQVELDAARMAIVKQNAAIIQMQSDADTMTAQASARALSVLAQPKKVWKNLDTVKGLNAWIGQQQ